MPNNIDVKEMLMSAYYDLDMIKYQDEIIDLTSEIYNSDCNTYFKGQAIHHLANLYGEIGKVELAEKWANKSYTLFHSKEILFTSIFNGEETIKHVSWCMYWFLYEMYWFAARIVYDKEIKRDLKYKQNIFKTVADIYEVVYKNDDMSFEMLKLSHILHGDIAKWETLTTNNVFKGKLHKKELN